MKRSILLSLALCVSLTAVALDEVAKESLRSFEKNYKDGIFALQKNDCIEAYLHFESALMVLGDLDHGKKSSVLLLRASSKAKVATKHTLGMAYDLMLNYKFKEARSVLLSALEELQDKEGIHKALMDVYNAAEQFRLLKTVHRDERKFGSAIREARDLIAVRRYDDANKHVNRACSLKPGDQRATNMLKEIAKLKKPPKGDSVKPAKPQEEGGAF